MGPVLAFQPTQPFGGERQLVTIPQSVRWRRGSVFPPAVSHLSSCRQIWANVCIRVIPMEPGTTAIAGTMEDGGDTDARTEMTGIRGDGEHGLGRHPEQQVVNLRLVVKGDVGDLGGNVKTTWK